MDAARGQGKTSLTAVLALFEILGGAEGAQVVVVATDERQAGLCFRAASRMVELHSELGATVLGRLSTYSADHSADPLVVWREHSAVGFEDHPVDCRHCWELANPAGGDFVAWDGLEACLPPKMREASFRRARLCQLTDQLEEAWLPPSAWAACADATRSIPDGAEVVVAFDGSFNGDTTVLVVASVDQRPGSMRPSSMANSPTAVTAGWPVTSATPCFGRMPAGLGWPRNERTHPGGSTPPWPPSWRMTGPPLWPV